MGYHTAHRTFRGACETHLTQKTLAHQTSFTPRSPRVSENMRANFSVPVCGNPYRFGASCGFGASGGMPLVCLIYSSNCSPVFTSLQFLLLQSLPIFMCAANRQFVVRNVLVAPDAGRVVLRIASITQTLVRKPDLQGNRFLESVPTSPAAGLVEPRIGCGDASSKQLHGIRQ